MERRRSVHLCGLYRYTKYGLASPPVFSCPESEPRLDLRRHRLELARGACGEDGGQRGIGVRRDWPDDYVDDAHLPRIITLLEENTRQDAKMVKEWH
jgi:hypothetical protein